MMSIKQRNVFRQNVTVYVMSVTHILYHLAQCFSNIFPPSCHCDGAQHVLNNVNNIFCTVRVAQSV